MAPKNPKKTGRDVLEKRRVKKAKRAERTVKARKQDRLAA